VRTLLEWLCESCWSGCANPVGVVVRILLEWLCDVADRNTNPQLDAARADQCVRQLGPALEHQRRRRQVSYRLKGPSFSYHLKGPSFSYRLKGPSFSYNLKGPSFSYHLKWPSVARCLPVLNPVMFLVGGAVPARCSSSPLFGGWLHGGSTLDLYVSLMSAPCPPDVSSVSA
jgi:hypothetical protein